MPTHYEGSETERQALDTYIKLARASESVARRALSCVQESGLTEGQFGVLEALYHLGPMMLSELARKHLRSPNNLTVIVDNLEKQALVRREPDRKDRRVTRVYLTERGEAKIAELFPRHAAAVTQEMAVLSAEEHAVLGSLLRRLGKGSEAGAQPA